jgi:hypothetical protein
MFMYIFPKKIFDGKREQRRKNEKNRHENEK